MSLETRFDDLTTEIATQIKDTRIKSGGTAAFDLSTLTTTVKTSLIAAINEVSTAAGNAAIINDAAASATTTYSGNKIDADIAAAVASLVNGSQATLDTLGEIAAALGNDENFAATLTTNLGLKANIADTKSVTELGAAVDTRDYAAEFLSKLV